MTQFHEGQEVEVLDCDDVVRPFRRKAKILGAFPGKLPEGKSRLYYVQFPDNTRAVFDAAHLRAVETYDDSAFDSAEYDREARR